MKKKLAGILVAALSLQVATKTSGQVHAAALQEWEDRKYSMFIHWGIYSVLGGVWEGKPVTRGLSEQIQAHAGIYSDTYARVAKLFDPEKWNPDSVVLLAKRSGMRSVVITSKHHDGFCMFKTATTDFNVVNATPYKRDVLKELSDACRRQGMKFGLYFSLIDWHYPEAAPISSHNSDRVTPEHHAYNLKQVTELLSNYGPVSELWFDMGSQSAEQSSEMRELVHKLQPDCMIGSRIGNDRGDFTVMGDNQEPNYIIGVPWQSPASFFDETWGYRSWQKRGSETDKVKEKLTSLIRVASRGGNFLLNIGPRGDGSVVEFEKDVLLTIGQWLQQNGTAIYGTQPDPFHVPFEWGAITSKPDTLFLHVLSMPKDGKIVLPGLTGNITRAYVIGGQDPIAFSRNAAGVTIQLPAGFYQDEMFKVIALVFKNGYTVPPANIITAGKNVQLQSHNAFKYYSSSGIDYNSRFQSTIKEAWTIQPEISGQYKPSLWYTAEEKGKTISLQLGAAIQPVTLNGGTAVPLQNTPVSWGPLYLQGPYWSGIEGAGGPVVNIDVQGAWPNAQAKAWQRTTWKNNETYTLPADITTAYYVLQEINSPVAQQVLVGITSGDGLVVWQNGKECLLNNNPDKKDSLQHVVLLNLEKGKNQLLIKLFNNFHKQAYFALHTGIEQAVYRKELPAVLLKKAQYFPVSWKLEHPVTPHQTLGLPNLSLQLQKQ